MNSAGAAILSPPDARIRALIETCCDAIEENASVLDLLDAAIGDGDHGTNMRRGATAIKRERDAISQLPANEALIFAGNALVMSVGGAAGPLYGTLLIQLGRNISSQPDREKFAKAIAMAVDAVAQRGRSQVGCKTMLDVLYPLTAAVLEGATIEIIARDVALWAEATKSLRALRGRASFLGERSVGHVDPGAASAAILAAAACRVLMDMRP